MPNRRLSLRKIKEILRLKLECGISEREISRSCQVYRSTVADYLRRTVAAKLKYKKDPSQRSVCLCATSKDIGINYTCKHACAYCYATTSSITAERKFVEQSRFPNIMGRFEYCIYYCFTSFIYCAVYFTGNVLRKTLRKSIDKPYQDSLWRKSKRSKGLRCLFVLSGKYSKR